MNLESLQIVVQILKDKSDDFALELINRSAHVVKYLVDIED